MELLTSQEAAELLGVSASTVKRWAEEGLLEHIKTAGQHRRFERAVVERFRVSANAAQRPDDRWLELLIDTEDPHRLDARLLDERAHLGSWWRVAESLGPVLRELGDRWAEGRITVLDEHLASERLLRALARVCERLPAASTAPRALLATAEGDDHTLGLALVELTLRELGWRTLWAGRRTPPEVLAAQIGSFVPPIRMLALSASAASTSARELAAQAKLLGDSCRSANVALVLGGRGRWPDVLKYGTRLSSMEGLVAYATGLAR